MATFSYSPSFTASLRIRPNVKTVKFDDGNYEQRLKFGSFNNAPKIWSLTFTNKNNTERDNILSFLDARGGTESFDWTDPNSDAGKYICEEWQVDQTAYGVNTLTATFRQVFEP